MTSVVDKIRKRRNYKVTIGTDEVTLCALSLADRKRVDSLDEALDKSFFAIGRGLCHDDGSEAFPRVPGEDDKTYAIRVQTELAEIPTDTFVEIAAAINRIGSVPKLETLQKN